MYSDRTWKGRGVACRQVRTYHLYHENETLRSEIPTDDLPWTPQGRCRGDGDARRAGAWHHGHGQRERCRVRNPLWPRSGLLGDFRPDAPRKYVALSVGTHPCPYGIAYRRVDGVSTYGLFTKSVCSPLCGRNLNYQLQLSPELDTRGRM